MTISLVSIAFGGYGRFLGQFLAFASNMSPKPSEVVVVLGKDHGCQDLALMESIYPGVKIVHYTKGKPTFGKLRNIGISKTTSEWTWFVSVDDKPMPDAIKTFKRAIKDQDADYVAAKWYTIGLGLPLTEHTSPTPQESYERLRDGEKMGFMIAHSPFKRWLWEKHRYKNTDLPNYDFILHCILNGGKFVKADKPTTTYLRRPDSHARTKLKYIQKAANEEKKRMQDGIIEYYG